MSNSVVPAAAAAHAKQLVRNKKLIKRTADQKPAQDEQQAADKDDDAAHAIQTKEAQHLQTSMSDASLSADFSFAGALSAAADSASLAESAESSAQDDGGSMGDDGDGIGGTAVLLGALGLAGLGVAVLAGGGGKKNEAPDITSGTTATIAENAPVTTTVYTTVATDPDGDTLTYSLTGTDAALFNISAAGVVTLKASADFEAKSSYSFSVVASDGELTDTQAVTVTVTNVTGAGDPPVFTSGTTATVAENAATTTVVYDANVSGTGATFALGTGGDSALFTIDADDGEVRLINSANFEAKPSYTVDVIATQGGATTTRTVAVSVTNVTEAPVFSSGTTASTPENVPTTTVVYDANVNGTAATTFSLGTTGDSGSFTIDADDGEVRFKASPNFEVKSSYTVAVIASTGGESTTQNVTISVTDVNPEGPVFTSGTTASVAENSVPANTVAYDADATGTGAVTFTLTGADAGAFDINGTNGQVRFKAAPDFETDSQYTVTVVATDSVGSTSQTVTISVTDIVEPDSVPIDVGSATTAVTLDDALDGDILFTDDFALTTNVILTGFAEGDIIEVDNITNLNQYSFTTGSGAGGADDLEITFNSGGSVTAKIVLPDVIETPGFFSTYEGAVAAVGYDFMQIA